MTKDQVKGLFALAGIEVMKMWEISNKYWPDHVDYIAVRRDNPWWLIKTTKGLIEIGWRKRVISIDWDDTDICYVVTEDEVTKSEKMVHADSYIKAVEYLTSLQGYVMSQLPSS